MSVVGTLFPLASDARNGARNNIFIFDEVTKIQINILAAIGNGKYSVVISNTSMTISPTGQVYFKVWQNLAVTNVDVDVLTDQMNQVINFFSTLGYSIVQLQSSVDPTLFVWSIQW